MIRKSSKSILLHTLVSPNVINIEGEIHPKITSFSTCTEIEIGGNCVYVSKCTSILAQNDESRSSENQTRTKMKLPIYKYE
jgi:hypothetical protein